jgi:hypothetical protein
MEYGGEPRSAADSVQSPPEGDKGIVLKATGMITASGTTDVVFQDVATELPPRPVPGRRFFTGLSLKTVKL